MRATRVALEHEPVAEEQSTGVPASTAALELGTLAGAEFGIWEMSVGSMYDVEAEEVFIVLAGAGTVVIAPFEGRPAHTAELCPGTVMRLSAGMHTTWTVTETLRKIYFTPTEEHGSNS
nr:cupin domain-containing protein [Paeniglutamicibacter kerguelensis]